MISPLIRHSWWGGGWKGGGGMDEGGKKGETDRKVVDEFDGRYSLKNSVEYLLVIIQHSVHVLNPDSIHWTIKD